LQILSKKLCEATLLTQFSLQSYTPNDNYLKISDH